MAIKADGSVWAWGANDFGQVGNGTTFPSASGGQTVPVQVQGLPPGSDVVEISAGIRESLALKGDGSVWAWGSHVNEGAPDPHSLVPIEGLGTGSGVIAVSSGGVNLALKSDGSVWSWPVATRVLPCIRPF